MRERHTFFTKPNFGPRNCDRLSRDRLIKIAITLIAGLALAGCASIGSSGPGATRVRKLDAASLGNAQIAVVDLNDEIARNVIAGLRRDSFVGTFGNLPPVGQVIGQGDVLDITIWEAPPATLFAGSAGGSPAMSISPALNPQALQNSNLPPQMVSDQGSITIPFVGQVHAAGLRTQDLEGRIVAGLKGKAHLPQVLVRTSVNRSANVTVVGDVANSATIPLSAKGERLLDALAAAGGVKQPTNKTTIRLTRGEQTVSQPLETVLLDPAQNIALRPGDVVTVLYKPYSFTALGAVGTNSEIPFEATGLTLAQALARAGGLQDARADIRGVFVFRLESPDLLAGQLEGKPTNLTPDGRLPVIYNLDLSDPRSFFVAQGFPIRDGDVLYASNAPLADLQKFVSIISSMTFSIIGVGNAIK